MSVTFPHNYNPKELGQLDTEEGTVAYIATIKDEEEAKEWLRGHGYGDGYAAIMMQKRAVALSSKPKKK
jgi:hypothetical protein